jgi:integrase
MTSRKDAQRVAGEMEALANEAKDRGITEQRARKFVSDIFFMVNKDKLPTSTIKDYFQAWLKRIELETRESTAVRYASIVTQFVDFLGGVKTNRDLSSLSSADITRFRDNMAGNLSKGSTNLSLKVIRVALSQAVRDGLIDTNPAVKVTTLKRDDKTERRPFTMPELKLLYAHSDVEWRGMIMIGLYTGLRLSDVKSLTWQNIDLARAELRVTTQKTGRRQNIPLATPLAKYLAMLPGADRNPEQPLFPEANKTERTGTLSNQFYEILVSAGLAPKRSHKSNAKGRDSRRATISIGFHAFRHTATSLLKNAGATDAIAMDIIGHDSAAISANYTHIDTETKRNALNKMPDIFN